MLDAPATALQEIDRQNYKYATINRLKQLQNITMTYLFARFWMQFNDPVVTQNVGKFVLAFCGVTSSSFKEIKINGWRDSKDAETAPLACALSGEISHYGAVSCKRIKPEFFPECTHFFEGTVTRTDRPSTGRPFAVLEANHSERCVQQECSQINPAGVAQSELIRSRQADQPRNESVRYWRATDTENSEFSTII